MIRPIFCVLLVAAACAPRQAPAPVYKSMTADQADCYARAKAAGAGVYNPSIVWQMAVRNETEVAVYNACMRSKKAAADEKAAESEPNLSGPAKSEP